MTPADLASLSIGDSVLGAFDDYDEHTVLAIGPIRLTRAGYQYREAKLTLRGWHCTTRLRENGKEVLGKKATP